MSDTSVKLFGKEPALVGAFLQSVLAIALGLGVIPGLNVETAGLISAAGAAVFGAYVAYAVHQNLLPTIIAAFQALVAVAVAFGLDDVLVAHHLDAAKLTGLATAFLTGLLGLFLRQNADPKAGSPALPQEITVNHVVEGAEEEPVAPEAEDVQEAETAPVEPVDPDAPAADPSLIFSGQLDDGEEVQLR